MYEESKCIYKYIVSNYSVKHVRGQIVYRVYTRNVVRIAIIDYTFLSWYSVTI